MMIKVQNLMVDTHCLLFISVIYLFFITCCMQWESEMSRLKLELKQTMDMYNSACKDAVSANKTVLTVWYRKDKNHLYILGKIHALYKINFHIWHMHFLY